MNYSAIEIYQLEDGKTEISVRFDQDSVWLNLMQLTELFQRDKSVISRHINNIFKENELDKNSVVAKNATTASDGKVYIVEYYNLDAIISVGYRVNSKTATEFRKWATNTLRAHIIDGYTINRPRIAKNYEAFLKAVEQVKNLLPAGGAPAPGSAAGSP